jgi:exopolysaccharide biosynthesis WecB/TagA/CpsF family protein
MSGIDPVTLEKTELMKELSSLYIVRTATPFVVLRRMRLLEKKYAWRAVVGGTYALKRMLDIAEAVARWIEETYPGTKVKGTHHGYFKLFEEPEVIRKISESGAEILMVAFGAPRQDMWIGENRDKLVAGVAMGVGGLFDFYFGKLHGRPSG